MKKPSPSELRHLRHQTDKQIWSWSHWIQEPDHVSEQMMRVMFLVFRLIYVNVSVEWRERLGLSKVFDVLSKHFSKGEK